MKEARAILHIDMDSFFCSVERALNPVLDNRPLMVGSTGTRGVIVAASYDVKAKGVMQGMPTAQAQRLAPGVTILPPRHKIYTQISAGIFKVLATFSDRVEPASIDESYIDITSEAHGFEGAQVFGDEIKATIRDRFRLPCTIGIGPTRVIAKIVSAHSKPDGLRVIFPGEARAFLAPLPVRKLGGVGPRTEEILSGVGIRTLGDLAHYTDEQLVTLLGKSGPYLGAASRAESGDAVVSYADRREAKSMSKETTLAHDTDDWPTIESVLLFLSEGLASRMRKSKISGKTFVIKIRFDDFTTITRSKTLPRATHSEGAIFSLASDLFRANVGDRKIRLVGVGLHHLDEEEALPLELDLGLEEERPKETETLAVVDRIRSRYGDDAVKKARLL